MNIRETIKKLADVRGISGSENAACLTALSILKQYCPDAEIRNGNVIGRFGDFEEKRPAQIGEASLAFIIAPSILIPNSVPRIASPPNIMPIITCLAIYDILLAAFVRSVR